MNKSVKYMALGLVVLGLVLAWMAFMVSGKPSTDIEATARKAEAQAPAMHRTVVARKTIKAGQFLTAEDVHVRELPQASVGTFATISAVVGRGAAQAFAEGDLINDNSLLSGLSGMLQPGERAVAIKVDESNAVGHKVQPGDWVDVLVVLRKDGQEVTNTQARRLLERKRVLAYGAQIEPVRAPTAPPKEESKEPIGSKSNAAAEQLRANNPARTAVLAIEASEVPPLMLAERQGQVMLALRSPLEPHATQPAALNLLTADTAALPNVVTLEHLAAHAGSKSPAKLPVLELAKPAPIPTRQRPVDKPRTASMGTAVEFIRGTRSETVHY